MDSRESSQANLQTPTHLPFLDAKQDYIAVVKPKVAVYVPHTAGRWQKRRFRKAQCPIVERLCVSLMMHGRNNGKKLLANRIVKDSFEIIHLLTDQNPIQVRAECVRAGAVGGAGIEVGGWEGSGVEGANAAFVAANREAVCWRMRLSRCQVRPIVKSASSSGCTGK